jgi:hypothetical protein
MIWHAPIVKRKSLLIVRNPAGHRRVRRFTQVSRAVPCERFSSLSSPMICMTLWLSLLKSQLFQETELQILCIAPAGQTHISELALDRTETNSGTLLQRAPTPVS